MLPSSPVASRRPRARTSNEREMGATAIRGLLVVAAMLQRTSPVHSANVLALTLHDAPSHFVAFEPLIARLVAAGHNVTVVAHMRPRDAPAGAAYRYVGLGGRSSHSSARVPIPRRLGSSLAELAALRSLNARYAPFLRNAQLRRLTESGERFDLVVTETFVSRINLAVVDKLKAPFVLVSSTDLFPHTGCNLAACPNPACELWPHSGYRHRMTFYQRLWHAVETWISTAWLNLLVDSESQTMAEKLFDSPCSLKRFEKEASLVLLYSHFSFKQARSLPPNVIEIGGLAIRQPRRLHPYRSTGRGCSALHPHARSGLRGLISLERHLAIMRYVLRTLLLLPLLEACSSPATAYNILGLFPYPGRSHFVVFDALMTELAGRGHRVTVYTAVPTQPPFHSPNYSQVDLAGCFRLPDILSVHQMALSGRDKWRFAGDTLFRFMPSAEQLAECAPLLRLWNASTDEAAAYDLLVTETFNTDVFLLFGHQLRLPVIAFHSSLALPWMRDAVARPRHAAYIPHPYSELAAPLAFAQRLENLLLDAYSWSAYRLKSQRFYDAVASRLFHPEPPPIGRLLTRVSMLFLYEHSTANQAQPTVPAVASVAGLNIKPAKSVSQDLEKFINESKDGVVYFCMGSLLRGESFPEEKRNAFLYAFSKIPQRVVWKWEGDELPGKTDNIRISKWMPQRDILAHPNIKLFISHGGLLGTSEAVYEGVPILGIPIFGDQRTNIKAIEANGAGELLDYNDISNETVLLKIQKILADPE